MRYERHGAHGAKALRATVNGRRDTGIAGLTPPRMLLVGPYSDLRH